MNSSDEFSVQATPSVKLLTDSDARQAILNDPRQYAVDNDIIAADSDIEIKVVVNDRNTIHIPIASGEMVDEVMLNIEELQKIRAAGNFIGSAFTAGTAGSISTIGTSYSSISCLSTVGSLGSAA